MTTVEIPFEASPAVRSVLGQLGRTEDVRFSPDNRRLALAGFVRGVIGVFDIGLVDGPHGRQVVLTGGQLVRSPRLAFPHGLAFLDDDTIIVADRLNGVVVVRVPTPEAAGERLDVDVEVSTGFDLVCVPGSLEVVHGAEGTIEVLVCNNSDEPPRRFSAEGIPVDLSGGTITRHQLAVVSGQPMVKSSKVLLRRWLEVPDGICVSPSGEWIAVSNHRHRIVMIFNRSTAAETANPDAILRGVSYAHGVRFSADSRRLFVADAGAPFVHVFDQPQAGWGGVLFPARTVRVMENSVFQRGPEDPQEGGPKGIDLGLDGQVLVATSEHMPLAFFDADAMSEEGAQSADRDARLEYELDVLDSNIRAAAGATARIAALQASTSYKLTGPLRRLRRAWLGVRG